MHWDTGTFLRHETNGDAHVQLIGNQLQFVVRGPFPPLFVGSLLDATGRLLKDWQGVVWHPAIPCPNCLAKGSPEKPAGNFPLLPTLAYKRKSPEKTTKWCDTCCDEVNLDEIFLGGWGASNSVDIERLTAGFGEVHRRFDIVDMKLDDLKAEGPKNAAEARSELGRLYEFINDQRRLAPSTFSLIPLTPKWYNVASSKYMLTLWCENPDGPHPVAPIGSKQDGDYELEFANEWVVRVAPYVKWTLLTLKAAVPIAGAVLKAGIDEALFKDVDKQLSVGIEAMKALPSGEMTVSERPSKQLEMSLKVDEGDLRSFHQLLHESVKSRTWGNLMYSELPDRSRCWLCPKCRGKHSPPPQASLAKTEK
ncbi:MAG: hypothetical protein H7210_00985 [Pyrinomonadaceae bacterium]|nr:hypothetical protein [Phycisphaerales bacterium]